MSRDSLCSFCAPLIFSAENTKKSTRLMSVNLSTLQMIHIQNSRFD